MNIVKSIVAALTPKKAPGATVPVPTLATRVAALVLAKNNALFPIPLITTYPIPMENGAIHKIGAATAVAIAKQIIASATGPITVPILMAWPCVESVFDPAAQNGNTQSGGSNPKNDPTGYDIGIAQLKIIYLMANKNLSCTDAYVFAKNINAAIPYMAADMLGLLSYADKLISTATSSTIPQFLNRYHVAALCYNFGDTGGAKMFAEAKTLPNHCKQVADLEATFAKSLGLPSVFAA